MRERKKEMHTSDVKTSHACCRGVSVDEDGVVTTGSLPPRFHCANAFTTHATDSGDIARCVECCNSRRIYCDLAVKYREVGVTSISDIVGMLLIVDELLDEIGKVVLLDFSSNIFGINFAYCGYKSAH
jgi:hypothetical protein